MNFGKHVKGCLQRKRYRGVENDEIDAAILKSVYVEVCVRCRREFDHVTVIPSVDRTYILERDAPYATKDRINASFLCQECNMDKSGEDTYFRAKHWEDTMEETIKRLSTPSTAACSIDFEEVKSEIRSRAKRLKMDISDKVCDTCHTRLPFKFFYLDKRDPHFFDLHYGRFYTKTCNMCSVRKRNEDKVVCNVCNQPIQQPVHDFARDLSVLQRVMHADIAHSPEHRIGHKDGYAHFKCIGERNIYWERVTNRLPRLRQLYAEMMDKWQKASPATREAALVNPEHEQYVIIENFERAKMWHTTKKDRRPDYSDPEYTLRYYCFKKGALHCDGILNCIFAYAKEPQTVSDVLLEMGFNDNIIKCILFYCFEQKKKKRITVKKETTLPNVPEPELSLKYVYFKTAPRIYSIIYHYYREENPWDRLCPLSLLRDECIFI